MSELAGWQKLPGWFSFSPLYDGFIASAKDGYTIVEVGSAFGRSLMYLARKVIDSGKRIRVVGIDPWLLGDAQALPRHESVADGRPFVNVLQQMLTHCPEELDYVTLLRCTSVEASCMFDYDSLHAVFIDGDHSEHGVIDDLRAWGGKVKPGGTLAGHDIDLDGSDGHPGGVYQAVNSELGREGVGYRRWRDERPPEQCEWMQGANLIPHWGGPCWVRI